MVMRGDKFAGVIWDPWWRERKSGERRRGQRRSVLERSSHGKAGHPLSSEADSFQALCLVHDSRTAGERRNGIDRRKSSSRERLVGVADFVRELAKGALSDENARLLVRICAGLTTREVYEGWMKISGMAPFFREPDWSERENHEKFRVYAVASLLDLLRPGIIHWKGQSPSVDDVRAVSRILVVFARATPNVKLHAVSAFVEGKVELEGMRKILSGHSLTDRKESLLLAWAKRKLKPKAFYEELRGPLADLGIQLASKPDTYRKQIERLKKNAEVYVARLSR